MEFMGPNDQSPDAGKTLEKLVRPMVRKAGA